MTDKGYQEKRSGVDRRTGHDPLVDRPTNASEAIERANAMYEEFRVRGGDRRIKAKIEFLRKAYGEYVDGLKTDADRAKARAEFNEYAAQVQLQQQAKKD